MKINQRSMKTWRGGIFERCDLKMCLNSENEIILRSLIFQRSNEKIVTWTNAHTGGQTDKELPTCGPDELALLEPCLGKQESKLVRSVHQHTWHQPGLCSVGFGKAQENVALLTSTLPTFLYLSLYTPIIHFILSRFRQQVCRLLWCEQYCAKSHLCTWRTKI